MKVHAFARYEHFMAHLAPIWDELPHGLKGWKCLDVSRQPMPPQSEPDDIVMIAGADDAFIDRRLVYVEHGAGQRYVNFESEKARKHYGIPSERVIAHIVPRQQMVDESPVPAFAAGAPICDGHPLFGEPDTVAISFHWNAHRVCPEATNALAHYINDLGRLVVQWRRQGLHVYGHHHPRFPAMAHHWEALRVPVISADEIRQRVNVLIADNTSLAYEMAYLGRNVVSLNAPWFRRDVEHGLRFWSHVPGVAVDSPAELADLNPSNLKGAWRGETTEYVYGRAMNYGLDGKRAAAWLTQFVMGL